MVKMLQLADITLNRCKSIILSIYIYKIGKLNKTKIHESKTVLIFL